MLRRLHLLIGLLGVLFFFITGQLMHLPCLLFLQTFA